MAARMGLLLLLGLIPCARATALSSLMGSHSHTPSSPSSRRAAFAPVAPPSIFRPQPAVSHRPLGAPTVSSRIAALQPSPPPLGAFLPVAAPSKGLLVRDRGGFGILAARMDSAREKTRLETSQSVGHKVLVLNASFEPLSVVSARRALALLWDNKASQVVPHDKKWISCSGLEVDLPSVVCLRRYIKVRPKYPNVNRRTVLMRDHGLCQYCGSLAENIDHVIPRCRGGSNYWDNVVASCAHCNNRKADKLLKDTEMKLKRPPQLPSPVSWVHSVVWKIDHRWKPYIGDYTWQDVEAMWKGTKLDKSKKKQCTKAGKRKVKAKAPPAEGGGGKAAAGGMAGKAQQVAQGEVAKVLDAYSGAK